MGQLGQELIQLLLAVRKLSSTRVIDSKAGHDTINDEEAIFIAGKLGCEGIEKLELMLPNVRVYHKHKDRTDLPHYSEPDRMRCFLALAQDPLPTSVPANLGFSNSNSLLPNLSAICAILEP